MNVDPLPIVTVPQAVMHHNLREDSVQYFGSVEQPFVEASVLAHSLLSIKPSAGSLLLHRKRRPVVFAQRRANVDTVCHVDGLEHDVGMRQGGGGAWAGTQAGPFPSCTKILTHNQYDKCTQCSHAQ